MKRRCYDKKQRKYPEYGGRGIRVCARWRKLFANFIADMGPRPSLRHSIERLDSDGNYTPKNCIWATARRQNRNRKFRRAKK